MAKPGNIRSRAAETARQVERATMRRAGDVSTPPPSARPAVLLALLRERLVMPCPDCGHETRQRDCDTCHSTGMVPDARTLAACEAAYEHGISPGDQRAMLLAQLVEIDMDVQQGRVLPTAAHGLRFKAHELLARLTETEVAPAGVPGRITFVGALPPELAHPDPMGDRLVVESPRGGGSPDGGV